jgi:hypothetical protein
MASDQRKLDVADRERAIFRYLRELGPDAGATIGQIHRKITVDGIALTATSEPVRDNVTVQNYHKLVSRLVATRRLVELPAASEGRRYTLADHLHSENSLRLDDLDELLQQLAPTEAIAKLLDAREYVRENRDGVLAKAARALCDVPPRELIYDLITTKIDIFNKDLEAWLDSSDDDKHLRRLKAERAELDQICYRWFGLDQATVTVPPGGNQMGKISYDAARLRRQLAHRVFGDTVIRRVPVANASSPSSWDNVVIAGSDGSTYSGAIQIDTAAGFVDDRSAEIITFNNSMVYMHLEGQNRQRHPHPLYSVPITRSAIDSPDNAGMVMAPFMYRHDGLSESDYEHMAKCATDVVQWRADERVFLGDAPAMGEGPSRMLPPPRVHFRDGTVTLQERESHHYQRNDAYGEMVRSGVRLSHGILRHMLSRRQRPVFAGAVKSSQLHLFATVVNWFIAHGLPSANIAAVEPSWDVSRGARLADNEAMTLLLSTLIDQRDDDFFCSFVVARPFHALTDQYRNYEAEKPNFWTEKFRGHQDAHVNDPMLDSYWKSVDAIEDDPYIRMCEEADYALFYIGHTGGEPAPLAPRYEFLESLRPLSQDDAEKLVQRNVELIVSALDRTGFTNDLDHNFLTRTRLVKIVPKVVYEAHERCKQLGRMLEGELKSMVVASLCRIGLIRRNNPDAAQVVPVHVARAVRVEIEARQTKEIEDE